MDQQKNQDRTAQRQDQAQGNQGQGNRPGNPNQGNRTQTNPGQGGQQNCNQGQTPNRDQAEGSREKIRGDERGLGSQGEKNRESGQRERGAGITNRGLDREMNEQAELPGRGRSRSEDFSDEESER